MFNKILDFLVPFGPFLRSAEDKKSFSGLRKLVLQVIPFTFFIHWLFTLLPFGTLVYFLVLVPLSARYHISLKRIQASQDRDFIYLWYLVILIVGFGGLRGFIGHFFLSDSVAQSIGWQTGSPFQLELAFYHLGTAVAAFMAIWMKKQLTEGLAVIKSIFGLGAAYVHMKDVFLYSNYAIGNTGSVLIGNIIIPLIFIFLLFRLKK